MVIKNFVICFYLLCHQSVIITVLQRISALHCIYSGLQLCACKVVYVMRACSVDGISVCCMTLLMSIEIWNLCAK